MVSRFLALPGLLALGLTLGLALLPTAPATALLAPAAPSQTQTVAFTSTPPTGADWFYGNESGVLGYTASASASSGLPVDYSIAPESADVCRINVVHEARAWIQFTGAGTCTVRADQAGDEQYLPAEQASQSFVIERVRSSLSGLKGRKGIPGLTPATFSATLLVPYRINSHDSGERGYPAQVVTFSVAGKPVCSGTTNANGVATCTASLRLATWATQLRFTASYAGDERYKPATANGIFIG